MLMKLTTAELESWSRPPGVAVDIEAGFEPIANELPPSYEAVKISDEDPPPTYAEYVLKEIKLKADMNTDDNVDKIVESKKWRPLSHWLTKQILTDEQLRQGLKRCNLMDLFCFHW